MKLIKSIAIGSLLLGFIGTAYAEGGAERARQFNQNFRADQANLWNDDSSNEQKQQVAQEQENESQDRQGKGKN